MNREEFLKKTLPINLDIISKYPEVNIVLLNYNSKGDLNEWIQPYLTNIQLEYFEERTREYFHMSHAKNMTLRLGTATHVLSFDSDNFLTDVYLRSVLTAIDKGAEYLHFISKIADGGFSGRTGASKRLLEQVKGMDEAFVGWGGDDLDFTARCLATKCKRAYCVIDTRCILHQRNKGSNYAPGLQNIAETYKSNQELMKDLTRAVNPTGWGQGTVYDKNNNQLILN
jgi:hypothetical protein